MGAHEELKLQRVEKLKRLKALGASPYGGKFKASHTIASLRENFQPAADKADDVRLRGRLITVRGHGKACFADLRDETGKIQIYVKDENLPGRSRDIFALLDRGDFIGVEGAPFVTRTGEYTVMVKDLAVLSKSLLPLPEKWHGLKDQELRYRRRYLDMLGNESSRDVFEKRIKVLSSVRRFFESRGYREVETPMLQPQAGGAAGKPFKTHADSLDRDLYLRIAPELYLKRLLVGGWEKIFELNRSFRNEGLSPRHNPEFTMLEVYTAFADYEDMMDLTEELFVYTAAEVCGKPAVISNGNEIDISRPWERVTFSEAVNGRFGVDMEKDGVEALKEKLVRSGMKLEKGQNISRMQVIKMLSEFVTSEKPVFVTDYPTDFCPLAKTKPDNPALTERFELFMCGKEIANAYSELNDPVEQRERFQMQVEDDEKHLIDEDFITALEYGMPPAAGLGVGIDRMVMALTGAQSIRDVLLFPQLKELENPGEKE